MKRSYKLFLDEKSKGPFSYDQIREMWRAGHIMSDTYILEEGETEWVLFSDVEEFFVDALRGLPEKAEENEEGLKVNPASSSGKTGGDSSCFLGCLGLIGVIFLFGFISDSCGGSRPTYRSPSRPVGDSEYEKEIIDGIKAFDPDYELSEDDKRFIERMGRHLEKEYPR